MRKQLKYNWKLVRTLRRVPTFCTHTNWTLVGTMWTTVGRGRAIRNEKFDVESGAYVGIDFEAKLDFAPWLGLMKLGWGSVCRRRTTFIFKFCTALLLLYASVSSECCRAQSQLSNAHIIIFQLVRSGENEPPDCLCAIRRSAPSQRGAFWWNFRLILGLLNRPLQPHWHSLNRKIRDL